jgi:GTPase
LTENFISNAYVAERCLIIHPDVAREKAAHFDPIARLDEAIGLAQALDLEVVGAEVISLRQIKAATFFGQGRVDDLAQMCAESNADVCLIDTSLTPVQQRNLERALKIKVIDRTGLILEIFALRARTREGRLQVELARLEYQKSRLVRSWTHLERQRATGTTGGPGETQIELDRRMIADRIKVLKSDLAEVRRTRSLHRAARQKVPYPIVALIGYTNAGKSTLFNHLTKAQVLAKDMLFATLDTTLRTLRLPEGRSALLSDTVGFISDLPHELIDAFRATLEEVVEADLILHVRDMSNEAAGAQARDVEAVLRQIYPDMPQERLIEVWNKIDLLADEEKDQLYNQSLLRRDFTRPVLVSSVTGEGAEALLSLIAQKVDEAGTELDIRLEAHEGRKLAFLYQQARVLGRHDDLDGAIHLRVKLSDQALGRFEQMAG